MTDHDPSSPDEFVAQLVRDAAPRRFASGFAERVHARVVAERAHSVSRALERQFVRIVPLAAAATLMLAAYNWWGARGTTSSAIDAALNLPQVTLASAYSASALFGTSGASAEMP